jgi:hypothetical protein
MATSRCAGVTEAAAAAAAAATRALMAAQAPTSVICWGATVLGSSGRDLQGSEEAMWYSRDIHYCCKATTAVSGKLMRCRMCA